MLGKFFSLLTGGALGRAFDLLDRFVPSADEKERLKTELAIEAGRQHVQALAATASFRWWHPQNLIAYSISLYVLKIVVWDTVLGLGVTPDPGSHVHWLMMTVVGFYFLNSGLSEVATRIAAGRK
jgi:hypothetical protein